MNKHVKKIIEGAPAMEVLAEGPKTKTPPDLTFRVHRPDDGLVLEVLVWESAKNAAPGRYLSLIFTGSKSGVPLSGSGEYDGSLAIEFHGATSELSDDLYDEVTDAIDDAPEFDAFVSDLYA